MSLVNKILNSAEQMQVTEIMAKITAIEKDTADLKVEMYENIVAKYADFISDVTEAQQLADKVDALTQDICETRTMIETEIQDQLVSSTTEFSNLQARLKEVTETANVVERLAHIERLFSKIPTTFKDGDLLVAAEAFVEISALMTSLKNDGYSESDIHVLSAIKEEYCVQREEFLFSLSEMWKERLQWIVSPEKDSTFVRAQLVITKGSDSFKDIVMATSRVGVLQYRMKAFTDVLMKNFLSPVITDGKCDVTVNRTSTRTVIEVVNTHVNVAPSDESSTPQIVFGKLLDIFTALYEDVLNVFVDGALTDENDEDSARGTCLMEIVGSSCSSDMLAQLVSGPLLYSIPTSHEDLPTYSDVIDSIKHFHETLIGMKFLSSDEVLLMDFVKNIDMLFVNKKSRSIIKKAHDMMKSVLHETVHASSDGMRGRKSEAKSVKLEKDAETSSRTSNTSFEFPSCHISVCVRDIVTLARHTLQEATEQSSLHSSEKLFYSVKNIFELFCSVVPTYHRQSLASLPQIAAIHYNNCMYITHHLMTLGFEFAQKMPPPLNKEDVCTFVDIIHKIRKIGGECFCAQMNTQKSQLLEFISEANGFRDAAQPDNFQRIERAQKQCLYQLNHLQNIWQPILPSNTYTKAIGTLINAVMGEMISNVLAVEDISTDDAVQLHELLSRLKTTAAGLFHAEDPVGARSLHEIDLQKNVKKTVALSELLGVLNGGLQDVVDRWSDGKGPLAMVYQSTEIKQLVRALFQNTDRRAAVLAKIH